MWKHLACLEDGSTKVEAALVERALLVSSSVPLRALSSAVLNGGPRRVRYIINYQVPKNYRARNPKRTLIRAAQRLGIPVRETAGLMTAANMRNAVVKVFRAEDVEFLLAVTAGVSNAIAIGDAPPRAVGTINVIVIVNANLPYPCLVEAAKTITEGKADAMRLLDVRSPTSRLPAVGTSTDSLVVACTGQGSKIRYAGLATSLGSLLGKATRDLVLQAVERQDGLSWSRSADKKLFERGILLDDLLQRAVTVLRVRSRSTEPDKLKNSVLKLLKHPATSSLMAAALRADDDLLASSSKEAMKLMGEAIARYFSGGEGSKVFQKLALHIRLNTYAEWLLAGLAAGVLASTP